MAMSSSLVSLISSSVAVVLVALLFLLSTSYCLIHHNQGLVVAEKTRLGSTPPSCHNKCNLCHPCMAVQVPTLPSHNRVQPAAAAAAEITSLPHPQSYFESSPSAGGNRYSNYKPLGWKCRCDGHFYNP